MHSIKDTVKQLIGKSLDAYNKKYTSPINNRIDNIVAQAGTDNTEIVDARIDSAGVSHTTLNNRILAETKMTDEKLIEYTGSSLSVDDTMPGYLQNIEIKGNTIQNEDNLEDIRSVGDKIEGQEIYEIPVLSVGKNLFKKWDIGYVSSSTGVENSRDNAVRTDFIKVSNCVNVSISNLAAGASKFVVKYDKNKQYLSRSSIVTSETLVTDIPTNCHYIRVTQFEISDMSNVKNAMIEKGTVATPYEPYQEDKLTILSPVQLEKVGDVRDRIICKDGVWGVEKNVKTVRLGSESAWYMRTNKNGITIFNTKDYLSNNIPNRVILCDTLTVSNGADQDAIDGYNQILAHKNSNYSQNLYISKDFKNIQLFTAWLDENPVNIKCVTETQPQFIPLPHDQQIKLRTFANKTNISFLTEIEGTIKAQVPKSLGATVNTHTEQISNLNKELDRVKKLEESTVSTVETESDFTTVEATSNGYFEDVKLEGKTLVVNSDNEIVEPGTDGAMLKSVGDGADEIVVLSCNENLISMEDIKSQNNYIPSNSNYYIQPVFVGKGNTCHMNVELNGVSTDSNIVFLLSNQKVNPHHSYKKIVFPNYSTLEISDSIKADDEGYVYLACHMLTNLEKATSFINKISLSCKDNKYTPHKSDKKRLLYYNDETQTWEKPILRRWDSIEKHADGKYYYHQRSGEVILNDSENWGMSGSNFGEFACFYLSFNLKINGKSVLSDKFASLEPMQTEANSVIGEGISTHHTTPSFRVIVNKSKLSTQDVAGFKQWLQANNVTVVYQLAEEKVYECTNIDLITYANETNYIVESGAIVPRTTLKVHNNISNVVSLLQKKVSLLESNITNYMITQNRIQLASTYSADSVTFKVDYALCSEEVEYNEDLYNLILNNILVGKDNYDYDKMFNIILDYTSWNQISWEQFDILVGVMDIRHNPPVEDEVIEEIPNEIM